MEMKNTRASSIFCLFVGIQATVGILIEKPENTVAMLSQTITLKCKSDEDLKLQWHTFENDAEKEELWNGYSLNPKACPCSSCNIDNHKPGEYNLNITATKETAKHYMCTEPGSFQSVSASLIVIESKLRCTYCTSSGHLILTCAIRFYGIWAPKIKWSRSSGHVNDAIENGEVTSTLTIPPMSQEVNYTASVYFSETDRPTEVTATNIPTYDAEWSSPLFTAEGYGEGTIWKQVVNTTVSLTVGACIGAAGHKLYTIKSGNTMEKSDPEENKNFCKKKDRCFSDASTNAPEEGDDV